jgi:Fic family protein
MDITMWIEWYAKTLLLSLQDAENKLSYIYQKVAFWDKHRDDELNARQIKVLNKILDIGVEIFGDINRKNINPLRCK